MICFTTLRMFNDLPKYLCMKISFCFNGIVEDSAVELAWIRLIDLFNNVGVITKRIFGERSSLIHKRRSLMQGEIVVCANIWQVILIRMIGLGLNIWIVYWVQGLVAEESYNKRKSRIRYWSLRAIEWLAFCCSNSFIYVSSYMKEFYERRFPFLIKSSSVILPCVSDLELRSDVIREKDSYCYIGGMAAWQRFDLVIKLMNRIIDDNPMVVFRVATKEKYQCQNILERYGSEKLKKATTISTLVGKTAVEKFLSACEFGFLIRDDININAVSSPIKLAEYLSCGVAVISTMGVRSYSFIIQRAGVLIDVHHELEEKVWRRFSYPGPDVAVEFYRGFFSNEAVLADLNEFKKREFGKIKL